VPSTNGQGNVGDNNGQNNGQNNFVPTVPKDPVYVPPVVPEKPKDPV
jgi:hypothetical protein